MVAATARTRYGYINVRECGKLLWKDLPKDDRHL